jgi:DNA replication protein DnaC
METLQKSLEAFMKSHNLDSKVDRHLERLLHHPAVKEWRAKHPEWTRDKLLGHAGKIREFVQEQQNCNGCRGLYECRNLMRGHRAGLIQYSGILDVTYSPCSYQLKKEQADKKEQLITSHHIPDDIMSARFSHFQQDLNRRSIKPDQADRAFSSQAGEGRGALLPSALNETAATNYAPDNGNRGGGGSGVSGVSHSSDSLDAAGGTADTVENVRLDAITGVLEFCLQAEPGKNGRGIYLYGPLGVGKSYLLGAACNKLKERDIATYMVYVPAFFREIKAAIADQQVDVKVQAMQQVPVLIFDDIGAETTSAWLRDEILGPILQYRMMAKLPTLYTSNYNYAQLEEHLAYSQKGGIERMKAKRIMERIRHYTDDYFFDGPNRRA